MAGIVALNGSQEKKLLTSIFKSKVGFTEYNLHEGQARFFININASCMVIADPVRAADINLHNRADAIFSYDELIQAIQAQWSDYNLNNFHIIAPVIGEGATEKHIVTLYKPPNASAPMIFDSKTSDPERLVAPADRRLSRRLVSGSVGSVRALNPSFSQTLDTEDKTVLAGLRGASYHALDTQSYLDPKTCGYHCAQVCKEIAEMVCEAPAIPVNVDNLLNRLKNRNPVDESLVILQDEEPQFNNNFFSFIQKAWYETYIKPVVKQGTRATDYSFLNYFAGLPSEGELKLFIYFVSLAFIVTPLVNTLKLPTEFLLKALAEGVYYLKDQIMLWAPTSAPLQYARSTLLFFTHLLHYVLEGSRLWVRTVTSPINSFNAGWRIHWSLGLTSAIVSAAAYTALAVFALPVLAGALASSGSGILTVIPQILTVIGTPIASAFAAIGLPLGAIASAGLLFLSGLAVVHAAKSALDWVVNKATAPGKLQSQVTGNNIKSSHSQDDFHFMSSGDESSCTPVKERKRSSSIGAVDLANAGQQAASLGIFSSAPGSPLPAQKQSEETWDPSSSPQWAR